MSEVDEVKKRIERRKKPLTNAPFNKLYNGMIRMMVLMIVVIGAMIVVNHPEIESQIFDNRYMKQFVTFVSQSIYSFLPEDHQVSQSVDYQKVKDDYYTGDSNRLIAFGKGKVIQVKKNDQLLGNYLVVLDENEVEITYSHLEEIQVKQFQEIKKDTVLATYNQKFQMTFEYLGKTITYQDYQGM